MGIKTLELHLNIDFLHFNFILLDFNNFVDCFSYVKHFNSFGEIFLVFVQNGVVEHIMDKVVYELGSADYFGCALV